MLTVCAPCSILPPPKYIYVYTWMYVHISKVLHALCVSWQCWKQFNALNYFGRWPSRSVTWVRSHHFMHAEADPFEQYLFWKLPKIPSPPRTDAGISMLRAGAGAPIKIIETTHRFARPMGSWPRSIQHKRLWQLNPHRSCVSISTCIYINCQASECW